MTSVTIRIPTELKEKLMKIAKEDDRSLSYIIRLAIEQYIENQSK